MIQIITDGINRIVETFTIIINVITESIGQIRNIYELLIATKAIIPVVVYGFPALIITLIMTVMFVKILNRVIEII